MSNEKSHKGTLLLSEENGHSMLGKGIDSEDEPKEYPMASGVCRKQKKARSAQDHNFTERIRRRQLNEKMKCLQELVPDCSRRDQASVLDDAIKYIKNLQYQLQMMSMAQGSTMSHVAWLMQSPGVQLPSFPWFPHSRPWCDCETISNLATSPASATAGPLSLGATPKLFSIPTPQAWELPAFPILGGASGDVTIPKYDFLESLLPLNSPRLAPFLGTSFPLAGADQVPVTGDESSSFFSCEWSHE